MEEYALRPDSGGAGRYRGGIGPHPPISFAGRQCRLQLRADRYVHAPYGLFGGGPAAASRNLIDEGEGWRALPGKTTLEISRDTPDPP